MKRARRAISARRERIAGQERRAVKKEEAQPRTWSVEGLVERGRDDEYVKVGVLWVAPFPLVAVIVSALILAALIFYICHRDTLAVIAVLLLFVFALSLRTIQWIKAFRPGGKQSQKTVFKDSVWLGFGIKLPQLTKPKLTHAKKYFGVSSLSLDKNCSYQQYAKNHSS
jgi:hypothetical protein